MITQYSELLLTLIKGAFMVAGFFTTVFIGFLIILLPFMLGAALFSLLDDGIPPEY